MSWLWNKNVTLETLWTGIELTLFDRLNHSGAIYVKMAGSVIDKTKTFFEMLALSFTATLNWQAASIPKIASEKTGPLIYSLTCLVSKGHPFGRYTIFSEKLKFLTQGIRNVSFSDNFAPVLKPL